MNKRLLIFLIVITNIVCIICITKVAFFGDTIDKITETTNEVVNKVKDIVDNDSCESAESKVKERSELFPYGYNERDDIYGDCNQYFVSSYCTTNAKCDKTFKSGCSVSMLDIKYGCPAACCVKVEE